MNPGQQNQTDQTASFFWILCIIVGVVLIIWWLEREWIVVPVYWLRMQEITLLKFMAIGWDKVAGFLHLPLLDTSTLTKLHTYMEGASPSKVQFSGFSTLNNYMGQWMRWPVMVILGALGALMYFKHGNIRFKNTYSMDTLKKVENKNWPQITPVMNLDLLKQGLDEGAWAMAKLPLDWCQENQLVHVTEINQRKVWGLDHAPTERLFVMQMGSLWRGVDALPIQTKALLVIFVARALRDRDIAHRFLSQIARSAGSGKLDFSGVEEQVQKYKDSKPIKWLEGRHAYVYTLMASLLEIARVDGVLATSEFLWLKPVDRRMWYVLNSVGRQTAFVESSGPLAHWLAEKKIGRALRTPMIKEAVVALETDMNNTLYVASEDKWHTYDAA